MWGETLLGRNEVGQTHGGDSEVDRMPLNTLNMSEVVGGWPKAMGDDGG